MSLLYAALLSGIILGITFIAGLLAVGAVTSRAEEEYWTEHWLDTPSTEVGRCSAVDAIIDAGPRSLRKAA